MKLNKKYLIIVIGAIALLLLLAILSTVGTVNLELKEIISALINNDNKSIIIAATLAPVETPVIPGSASGFFITDWSNTPATARLAPTIAAKIFLGNLIL